MDEIEALAAEAFDGGSISEVIRPAAILPEDLAHVVITELALRDVRCGGVWWTTPQSWRRYDRPWRGPEDPGAAVLLGTLQVIYGSPSRYAVTIYRATLTAAAGTAGWTVRALCDEALGLAGLSLDTCPRAEFAEPPTPFRLR
ncbi:MAG: hypothetical protein ACYCXA_02670 [Actinomycetes bacterium]